MSVAPLVLLLLAADPGPRPDLSKVPLDDLIARARKTVDDLGVYSFSVRKRERVDGKLTPEETLEMVMREKPYALRLEEVAGPHVGRKLVYNSTLRADEFRVHEPGAIGWLGSFWIGVHSSIAKNGTRHVVTDSGFGHLMAEFVADEDRSRPFGGRTRLEEGYDADGRYCIRTAAAAGATASYAPIARVCYDTASYLPMSVEVSDAQGLVESYFYSNIRPHLTVGDTYFTPDAMGL